MLAEPDAPKNVPNLFTVILQENGITMDGEVAIT